MLRNPAQARKFGTEYSQFAEMLANAVLTDQDIHEIFNELKVCYSLISAGWPQLEKILAGIVRSFAASDLFTEHIREVLDEAERMFDKDVWREKNERVFRSCFVLILARRTPSYLLTSVRDLLSEFPTFLGCHEAELVLLLKFRNMMKCGIVLFEAKSNKGKLMELAGRLSGKVCTTGGGSTADTKRREFIYETLGGVVKKKLTVPRKRKNSDDCSGASDDLGPALPRKYVKRVRRDPVRGIGTRGARAESPGLESVDSCLLYDPLPLERAISSITVDEPADLLLCDTASYPCSPLYSPTFSGLCFDESYFCDKGLQTPLSSDKDSAMHVHALSRPGAELFGQPAGTGATGTGGVGATVRPLHTYPYAPAAPALQRGLSIDLSKPMLADEFSFHLDLSMF